MATIFRVHGLRIVIYSNSHGPAHVLVIGPGAEAKIALRFKGAHPRVVSNNGLSAALLAAAMAEVDRNQALLAQRWRDIHGDT